MSDTFITRPDCMHNPDFCDLIQRLVDEGQSIPDMLQVIRVEYPGIEFSENDVVRALTEHEDHQTEDDVTNASFSGGAEQEAVAPLTASEERIMRAIRRWAACLEPMPEQYDMPPSPASPRAPFPLVYLSPTGSSLSLADLSPEDDGVENWESWNDDYDADDEDSLHGEDALSYYESEEDDFAYDVLEDDHLDFVGYDSSDEDSASFLFYYEDDEGEDGDEDDIEDEISDTSSQFSQESFEYATAVEY